MVSDSGRGILDPVAFCNKKYLGKILVALWVTPSVEVYGTTALKS